MPIDWKQLIIGGLGVMAVFKGTEHIISAGKKEGFRAEDWSGNSDDIPMAVSLIETTEDASINSSVIG